MHMKRFLAAAAVAGVGFMSVAPAAQAASITVLNWQLNESAGATKAVDSSGKGHAGTIGPDVQMGNGVADFPYYKGMNYDDAFVPNQARLITTPDAADDSLDPGTGNFSVEIKYRTTHKFGNLIQKGQATTAGGQVKIQLPQGRVSCMFKTDAGVATAGSGSRTFNDGAWHTILCKRTPSQVTLMIDGAVISRINHTTGDLNNNYPWSVGGKPECNGTTIECDYFAGDVDYVKLTKG